MYEIIISSKAKKDLKKIKKNTKDFNSVIEVIDLLEIDGLKAIPKKMKPHRLKGDYNDLLECHIKPDILIIWLQIEKINQ